MPILAMASIASTTLNCQGGHDDVPGSAPNSRGRKLRGLHFSTSAHSEHGNDYWGIRVAGNRPGLYTWVDSAVRICDGE